MEKKNKNSSKHRTRFEDKKNTVNPAEKDFKMDKDKLQAATILNRKNSKLEKNGRKINQISIR